MPTLLKTIAPLIAWMSFFSCTSPGPKSVSGAPALTLENADKLKINVTSAHELESIFGEPRYKFTNSQSTVESWSYCDEVQCSEGRLTVNIDLKTRLAREIIWKIKKTDREQNLQTAMSRYGGTGFSEQRILVDYGTYMYTVDTYIDRNSGIVLEYDEKEKAVMSIDRRDPKAADETMQANRKGLPRITTLQSSKTATNP